MHIIILQFFIERMHNPVYLKKSYLWIIFHIVLTIITIPFFCLFGINWIAYFATNYNLKREIEVERRRIEIIERKIAREDKDRESERDVFRGR